MAFIEDEDCNPSRNPSLREVLDAAVPRRRMLQGALGTAALGFLSPRTLLAQSLSALGFRGVAVSQDDRVLLPDGYTHEIVYAWGDPVSNGPAWDPNVGQGWAEQERQAGMHHDGLHFFPLPPGIEQLQPRAAGRQPRVHGRGPAAPDRPRPAHGGQGAASRRPRTAVSIVEIALERDRWDVVRPSSFAPAPHRLHADAPGRARRRPSAGCARARTRPGPRSRARSTTARMGTRPGAPT